MQIELTEYKKVLSGTLEWLSHEFESIRTGRATPVLLDSVSVEQYGAKIKISHVASISTEDAKTLRIVPWDKALIKQLDSSLRAANLGVSVIVDGEGLRVIFPDLTAERRIVFDKLVSDKLEQARISARRARDEAQSSFTAKEREGSLSEDEKFHLKQELQKLIDEFSVTAEQMAVRKRKEISQ